jgi:hypothetical protein
MDHVHEGGMAFEGVVREWNDHDYRGWRSGQRQAGEPFDEGG